MKNKNNKKKNNKFIKKIKVTFKRLKNNKFSFKDSICIMLITFFMGLLVGGLVMYGKGSISSNISDSLKEFINTYQDVLSNFYKEVDSDELLEAGLNGMMNYLGDPYSTYMTEDESSEFNEKVEGKYTGIGAEIKLENEIFSFGTIFENSPAMKVGIKTDDILLKVNDIDIKGKTTTGVADMVKGKSGTKVKLLIKRVDEEIEFEVTRGSIDIESVTSKIIEKKNKKIGYINISIFAENSDEQFEKHLLELENNNIDRLIIDVRSNSGGYLTSVTNIISMFMEKDSVLYQLNTKGKVEIVKDKTKESRKYPVVILTNGSSASASEVLTACFKENYGSLSIGTKTFGKGKVQKAYSLSNGSTIKYTFQEWLTPKGNQIDKIGIEPDDYIEYEYSKNKDKDNQLDEAVNEIIEQ